MFKRTKEGEGGKCGLEGNGKNRKNERLRLSEYMRVGRGACVSDSKNDDCQLGLIAIVE